MSINPEFRRNLWLELTPHRLLLMPAVLAAILAIAARFDVPGSSVVVAHVALGLGALLAVAWGGYQAGEGMIEEFRARTWDAQRMSALGPWSMAWGKLFGATIFSWYGAGLCLVVYLACNRGAPLPAAKIAAGTVACAVLVQAANLIIALSTARLLQRVRGVHGTLTTLATVMLASAAYNGQIDDTTPVVWLGLHVPLLDFLVMACVIMAAWGLLGAYRAMCIELQVPTVPWAWAAFVLYMTVFVGGGWTDFQGPAHLPLAVLAQTGFVIAAATAYLTAFAACTDRMALRRVASHATRHRWRRFFEELPLWVVSVATAALFALGAALLAPDVASAGGIAAIGPAAPVGCLLLIRDLLILQFFSYAPGTRRPAFTTIIYLALLYWLIPTLLGVAGQVEIAWLFHPPVTAKPLLAAVIAMAHVIAAGILARRRYRRYIAPPAGYAAALS